VSASDLDDVSQEVFPRLLRYDNAELIEHPQAYLFRMASNVAGANRWSCPRPVR
jgi:DNA-directed RNA polymerase specialized sigma24 family protein